jgi:hypothetical protein
VSGAQARRVKKTKKNNISCWCEMGGGETSCRGREERWKRNNNKRPRDIKRPPDAPSRARFLAMTSELRAGLRTVKKRKGKLFRGVRNDFLMYDETSLIYSVW